MSPLWVVLGLIVVVDIAVSVVHAQWCAPKLFETKRWTLQIRHTDHGADIVESISSLSFDVIGQRLASHETGTRNGQNYSVFYLYYYPAGVKFTVKDGVCTSSPLSGNVTDPCFSWTPSAHVVDYLTKEYIGDDHSGSPIMGAIYLQDGIGSLYSFSFEGNIPLFEGKDGEIDGVPTYTVSSYLNVTLGISDPTVFTPPDSCIQTQYCDDEVSNSAFIHALALVLTLTLLAFRPPKRLHKPWTTTLRWARL